MITSIGQYNEKLEELEILFSLVHDYGGFDLAPLELLEELEYLSFEIAEFEEDYFLGPL